MKKRSQHRKSIFIFYVLVGYVLLQISWWVYQIITLALAIDNSGGLSDHKVNMLAGEFSVFFILLVGGVIWIHRVFIKESKLSQSKKDFSDSITHELKTPIASSILFLETLLSRDLDTQTRTGILEKVVGEQKRLNELIENILLSSRLSNTEISINTQSLNLAKLLQETLSKIPSDRTITVDVDETINIEVDPLYFTSVIINLHENAIKYSKSKSAIAWSCKLIKAKDVVLTVTDAGCGIAKNEQDRIFQMHYRSEDESTRSVKGTGLGLFLVKKIVELHNGTVHVVSQIGMGSTFEIQIPVKHK